jgi:hypothetical protein
VNKNTSQLAGERTHTLYLKHNGKIVARAFPWDSEGNREWQREKQSKLAGVELQWESGPDSDIIHI